MRKEMKEYNWGWWFVLSCIWLACVIVLEMNGTESRRQIMSDGFFYFTFATALINLLGCAYIGGMPPRRD